MNRIVLAGLIGSIALLAATVSTGATQEVPFRLDWRHEPDSPRGSVITGHVHNDTIYRVTAVRLRVEAVDGSGRVVHETSGWALGSIPAGATGHFLVSAPPTPGGYRVTVMSYDTIAREAPERPSSHQRARQPWSPGAGVLGAAGEPR